MRVCECLCLLMYKDRLEHSKSEFRIIGPVENRIRSHQAQKFRSGASCCLKAYEKEWMHCGCIAANKYNRAGVLRLSV